MDLHGLVLEMKHLELRLALYEKKYGILSQDFYDILIEGNYRATTILTRPEWISVGGKVFTKPGNAARQLIVNKFDKGIQQTYCVYNPLIDMGGNSLYSLVFCG